MWRRHGRRRSWIVWPSSASPTGPPTGPPLLPIGSEWALSQRAAGKAQPWRLEVSKAQPQAPRLPWLSLGLAAEWASPQARGQPRARRRWWAPEAGTVSRWSPRRAPPPATPPCRPRDPPGPPGPRPTCEGRYPLACRLPATVGHPPATHRPHRRTRTGRLAELAAFPTPLPYTPPHSPPYSPPYSPPTALPCASAPCIDSCALPRPPHTPHSTHCAGAAWHRGRRVCRTGGRG